MNVDEISIIDLDTQNDEYLQQVAALLYVGFKSNFPDWVPTIEQASAEVQSMLRPKYINRIALDKIGHVIGWTGGIPEYNGNVWELNPIVVHPDWQGQGIGSRLIDDFEDVVRAKGGITIYLGTDDETEMTSLSNKDLYPNIWEHVQNIQNLKGHPYSFYLKKGYVIVGVIPDANGFGKPDILMAKRVG